MSPLFLILFFLASCHATGKERSFTGSTPADPVIRSFLGIPQGDSIDFIRWQLFISDGQYHLHANYGIGKANTNGFINDGIKIELSGTLKKEEKYYSLQNGSKILRMLEFNEDLLHFVNNDNSLLVGNDGWSYMLNNMIPSAGDDGAVIAQPARLKDSMAFEGRTPCKVPGVIAAGKECYKLKWYVVLYADAGKNQPAGFKILGTRWRKEGGITGTWKIAKGKNDRIIYQLNVNQENLVLYLLKADENILAFADSNGKLLVGDEDFSYTLNRRF